MHTFLHNNNIIYNLHFGFSRQQYHTSHALIDISENIRKALDDGNICCRVFVDVKRAFDTIDHQALLSKLNHYGIHGVSNDLFKSYLSNCHQFVSINGYYSGLAVRNCGVPQGSVPGICSGIWSNNKILCIKSELSNSKQTSQSFCYLAYCSFAWTQNCATIELILALQKKKNFRVINFQPRNSHNNTLFKKKSSLIFKIKFA